MLKNTGELLLCFFFADEEQPGGESPGKRTNAQSKRHSPAYVVV